MFPFQIIVILVSQIFDSYLLKKTVLKDSLNKYGKSASEDELRQQIEAELFTVAESKKRLVKAVAGGTLSEDDIREEIQDLRDKETRLNRELSTIQQKTKQNDCLSERPRQIGHIAQRDLSGTRQVGDV